MSHNMTWNTSGRLTNGREEGFHCHSIHNSLDSDSSIWYGMEISAWSAGMVGIVPATVSWNISGGRGVVHLADLLTLRRFEGHGRPRSSKHDRDHEAELYL